MKRFVYELWQGGIMVASVDAATKKDALKEISHYALMYQQDGKVEIREKKVRR